MPKNDDDKRRIKGTGGLYQRKSDGMWCASVELPSADPNKRRRKVIVRSTRAAALSALREARKELEKAGDLPTAAPTVAQWCDLWWTRYGMKRLKVSTRKSHQSRVEQYIKPSIGRIRLDKLMPEHVYRLHEFVTVTKGLSPTTALGTHRVLSTMLTDAVREGRVNRNVCTLVDKPRAAKRKRIYLDNAQAREMLQRSAAEGEDEFPRWVVAILTGLRQGERLGLTVDAVDFERSTITVSWQLQRLTFQHGCGDRSGEHWPCERKRGGNCPDRFLDIPRDQEVIHVVGGLYLTRPKSAAGWRVVPMVGVVRDVLAAWMEQHPPAPNGLIFTRPNGKPVDPTDDYAAWINALDRYDLPMVDVHSARHTCNTVLTELGVPVDVRRQVLGHASNAINEAVYTHTSDSRVAEAMQELSTALDWRRDG